MNHERGYNVYEEKEGKAYNMYNRYVSLVTLFMPFFPLSTDTREEGGKGLVMTFASR